MTKQFKFDNLKYSKQAAGNVLSKISTSVAAGALPFGPPNTDEQAATVLAIRSVAYGLAKSLPYALLIPFGFIADIGRNTHYIAHILYNNGNKSEMFNDYSNENYCVSDDDYINPPQSPLVANPTPILSPSVSVSPAIQDPKFRSLQSNFLQSPTVQNNQDDKTKNDSVSSWEGLSDIDEQKRTGLSAQ